MNYTTPSQTEGRCEGDYHPLEMIAFFRRFRPNPLRDIIYTLIWNTAIGTGFWLISVMFGGARFSLEHWAWYLLIANIIGYAIHALFEVGGFFGIERRVRANGQVATPTVLTME